MLRNEVFMFSYLLTYTTFILQDTLFIILYMKVNDTAYNSMYHASVSTNKNNYNYFIYVRNLMNIQEVFILHNCNEF